MSEHRYKLSVNPSFVGTGCVWSVYSSCIELFISSFSSDFSGGSGIGCFSGCFILFDQSSFFGSKTLPFNSITPQPYP